MTPHYVTVPLASVVLAASIAGCGGDGQARHIGLAETCSHVEGGSWNAVEADTDDPDNFSADLGDGDFGSDLSQLATYGGWYFNGTGFKTLPNFSMTADDRADEASSDLQVVWAACASNVDGFPDTVSSGIDSQIRDGARKQFEASKP